MEAERGGSVGSRADVRSHIRIGFDEVVEVPFHFEGTEEEKQRWSRYLDCYPKGKWEGR